MFVYPAIDLREGQVVRLSQGDYDQMTVYSHDPEEVARGFLTAGAGCLHVVDLDGAKDGSPRNREVIRALCALPLFVEAGGGMRTEKAVEEILALGVKRAILGTVTVTDPALTDRLLKRFGERIAVGVDAREGLVATHGWQTVSNLNSVDFCKSLRDKGASTVIYTDISKDGQLAGTNLGIYEALGKIEGLNVIASGGVSYEREIAALRDMGVFGVILGKALYAGKLRLERALAIARGEAAPC